MFLLTTFLSLYAVFYYKREGYLPGASRVPSNAQAIDPDKDAFSTAPHDDEYAPVHNIDDHDHELDHNNLNGPLSPGGYGSSSYDHPSYGGSASGSAAPAYGAYAPPPPEDTGYHSGGEPQGYTGYMGATGRQSPVIGDNGRVHFPQARYDNV